LNVRASARNARAVAVAPFSSFHPASLFYPRRKHHRKERARGKREREKQGIIDAIITARNDDRGVRGVSHLAKYRAQHPRPIKAKESRESVPFDAGGSNLFVPLVLVDNALMKFNETAAL